MKIRKNQEPVVSYLTLRRCIGILGMLLPFVMMLGGLIQQPGIRSSISDYYYSNMRDFFVGLMCAVGLFLVTYKGYDNVDDLVSTASGIFAFGVAAFPTCRLDGTHGPEGIFLINDVYTKYAHLACAALFFLLLALNSIFLFTKTGGDAGQRTSRKRMRDAVYIFCGVAILVSLAGIILYVFFFEKSAVSRYNPVLFLETVSLAAFGLSWLVKGDTIFRDRIPEI
jgi:hypothetical protein